MKLKKKAKKTSARKPRMVPPPPLLSVEYFIDEAPTALTTQEMQDRTNELAKDGWRLMFLGQYGGQPNTIRVWYERKL